MIKLLGALVETVVSLVGFVINTISGFLQLIGNIPVYLAFITSSITHLPPFLIPFCSATVSVLVLQYIVNRKAG